jgi:large subunit ribosomal protein L6
MSRVGKMPVTVPAGVDVSIKEDQISVKGTGGTLNWPRTRWSRSVSKAASSALCRPTSRVKPTP